VRIILLNRVSAKCCVGLLAITLTDCDPLACSRTIGEKQPVSERTLIEGEKVVVPVSIRIRLKKRSSRAAWIDNPDISSLSGTRVQNIKCVGLRLDTGDYLFASPFPFSRWVPKVSDVFVWALRMRLGDARHLNVCHVVPFSLA
jgi:hypothetical protein